MSNANEYSFPFGSMNGDRMYKADEWRNVTRAMYSTGVFPVSPQLQVSAGAGMSVVISPGRACIDGVIYTLKEELIIELSDADGVLSRKDKIIITVDESARDTYGTKLAGTASAMPVAPSNRWTSSYKDICLAVVTVSAGMTSVPPSGSIQDTRFEVDLCGIAAPYQTPDTSGWFANFEAAYAAWEAEQQQAFDDWFAELVATLDENAAGNLLNLINEKIAALTPEDIGAEPSRLQFIDTVVNNTTFVSNATYADFPYRASVTLSGVLATMVPHVVFGAVDAVSGIFAPVAACYDGGVYLYAAEEPEADITVPTMIFWR